MRKLKEDPAMVHYKKTIEEEKQYALKHPEEVARDKKYKELELELNGEIFWEYEFEQEREGMCHCNVGMTPKQLEDELHGQVQSDPEYRDPNREMLGWDEEFDL